MTETLQQKDARLWAAVRDASDGQKADILAFLCGALKADAHFLEALESALRINCPERLQVKGER